MLIEASKLYESLDKVINNAWKKISSIYRKT